MKKKSTKNNLKEKLDILLDSLDHYWYMPDKDAVKVLLAATISFYFDCDPLWLFLVAPPSSLKTEFIRAFEEIENVYPLSDLTPQTFASGLRAKRGESHSLLDKLGSKILMLKDFTTVLSMRYDDQQKILAILRECYDGKYSHEFGNGVRVEWSGKLGLVAGVTEAIDTHYSIYNVLGERFVQYRLKDANPIKLSHKAISNIGQEEKIRQNIKVNFSNYFSQVLRTLPSIKEMELESRFLENITYLSAFVVRARSGVFRDSYRKELFYVPRPEAPARLVKQLGVLAYSLAVLEGRKKVSDKDYKIILKVGMDSIQAPRMKVLKVFSKHPFQLSTSKVSEMIGYSREGARRHLEDLAAHRILKMEKLGPGHADIWSLSKIAVKYLKMMQKGSKNSEYNPKKKQFNLRD